MTRKHYNEQECQARRWFSKTEWRRRGLKIRDGEKPVGTLWMAGRRGAIEVFGEGQGDRIKIPLREFKLRYALEQIAKATWKGDQLQDEAARALQAQAREMLKSVY